MNKFELYEHSVQSPAVQLDIYHFIYWEIRKKHAEVFREDFCGTFSLSTEWVKSHKKNIALALDLDPEPLAYGKKVNLATLTTEEKKRLIILKQNVISVTQRKADFIGACNFSFYIFKTREILIEYFRNCLRSLGRHGILVLEMAGGPGMIQQRKEQKTVKTTQGRKFRYVWDQKSFNPITREGRYAIHFKFSNGTKMQNAFTYEWRLWTIPEVRDALIEAGFSKTCVYWDEADTTDTTDYVRTEKADNHHAWIAQVVGIK